MMNKNTRIRISNLADSLLDATAKEEVQILEELRTLVGTGLKPPTAAAIQKALASEAEKKERFEKGDPVRVHLRPHPHGDGGRTMKHGQMTHAEYLRAIADDIEVDSGPDSSGVTSSEELLHVVAQFEAKAAQHRSAKSDAVADAYAVCADRLRALATRPTPEGSVRGEEITEEMVGLATAALIGSLGEPVNVTARRVVEAALSTPSPNPQGGETGECSPDEPACAYNNTTADSWCRVCLLDAFRSCEKAIQTGDIEEVGGLISNIDESALASSPGTDAPEPVGWVGENELCDIAVSTDNLIRCDRTLIEEQPHRGRALRVFVERTPPASRIPEGDAYDPRIHVWISHDQDDMWVDDLAEIEELEREGRDERGAVRAGFYSRTTWESLARSFAEELREADSVPEGDTPQNTGGPIWNWFGLSYSPWLVLSRVVLCSMPHDWQRRFLALIEELEDRFDTTDWPARFWVRVRAKDSNRFVHHPFQEYKRHPVLQPRSKEEE